MRTKSKFSIFGRTFSWLLSVVMIFGIFVVGNISEVKVNADDFIPRMSAPNSSISYYYSANPFYKSGYGMPNCTCYAYGRAYELLGSEPNLSRKNAGQWWYYNKKNGIYDYGSTPKLGAVACWDRYDEDRGHVAVVEAIDGNSVTISESHYQSTYFDTRVINADSSNYLTYMRFLGYIYIGNFNQIDFPGAEDTSYAVPVSLKAKQHDNTYDDNGNIEWNRWIDEGDDCYIEKVYTNGFCRVEYPAGNERRWAYAEAGLFDIPKKEVKVDIGTDFYAYIINTSAWKMVVDVDYNVQLQSENAYRNQIWYFERKDDLYYKITNIKTGDCLDVNNAGNTNGTNIAICGSNDSDAQRWCFTEHEGKYILHPKCAMNMALDVNGASTDDGANIQLWETNGTSAQDFTIWKFDNIPNKPTVTSDKNMYTTGNNVRVYWGENAFATSYWVDVWHNNEHTESFETNNIEYTINYK